MTAYELRRHLQAEHDVRLVGADYGTLVTVHDIEHRAVADHAHDDVERDDFAGGAAGHVHVADLVWLAFLLVFIVVGLRLLGLAL